MSRRRTAVICWTLAIVAPLHAVADDPPAPAPQPQGEQAPAQPPAEQSPAEQPPAEQPPAQPSSEAPADPVAPADAPPGGPVGTVKGRVLDASTQEGLPAATIRVLDGSNGGAGQSLAAELDGTYTLTLPPGTYTIELSTPEYVAQQRTVRVAEGQSATLELSLAPVPRQGKEEKIEVYSAIDTRKDSAVLAERRISATVSDAISAQQIARSPDSNASDAAKRMVAATIQDNRYIVIRGLGGRYSTTLLNGVPLPSPDPDVPAAPLDLFPASLITNLTVNKTFAPDMPGNFAGGALGIETRNYPTRFLFKARVGFAANTESSFRRVNGQQGGSLDMLGFDDGTRSLPSAIPDDRPAGETGLSVAQRNAQIAGFRNTWSIDRGTAGPNLGLGVTLGDTVKLLDRRLGYFGSVSFGHSYARRIAHLAKVGADNGNGGRDPSELQLDDNQGIEQASVGALAGAGWNPASGHKVDLFTLYSHSADISASEVTGIDANSAIIQRTRLQFVERDLLFTQLVGDSRLHDRAILEWQANVARTAQSEPDTRDLLRVRTDNGMVISTGSTSSERLFGELADTTYGGAAAVRMPFDVAKLKAGASIQRSAREYQVRRFHFDLAADSLFLSPDQAYAPENAGSRMSMAETTQPIDGYAAERTIAGVFAMADINVTRDLRLVGGARLERSHLEVGLESRLDLDAPAMERTERDDNDILPSLNAICAVTPSTNLRAAYSMTVARPNFREIAPTIYFDYVRRRVLSGNPDLRRTTIHNADLRWETFLGDSELLAASVFGKRFVDPIERTIMVAGSGDNISFQNQDSAISYGVELEARLSLGRLSSALAAFSVSGNLSLIGSRIDLGSGATRPLQGQSPYVANLGLGYEHRAARTRVDLAYNAFGRRIEEVGTAGAGDVHEEPVHRLDLTISQPLPRNLRLKLAAANLLDQRVVRTQDDVEIFAYPVGVTVLGSVEYSLE